MKWQKGSKPTLTLRIKAFEVFKRGSPLPDGLSTLLGGCTPWRCHTLAANRNSAMPQNITLFLMAVEKCGVIW